MTSQRPDPQPAFYGTMRQQIIATPFPQSSPYLWHRVIESLRSSRRALTGVMTATGGLVTAAIVAIVLLFGATANTPPAFAITDNPNGSVTIVLRQLSTGIPALNAELRQDNIAATVVPISASCHAQNAQHIVIHPNPLFETSREITWTLTPAGTPHSNPPPAGDSWIMAAKRLSHGKTLTYLGSIKNPVPSCLPYSSKPSSTGV